MKRSPITDAHYVIGRTGEVRDIIPLTEIANHTVGVNAVSIGIELVHRGDGEEQFADVQLAKLIELIRSLRREFPDIALRNIVAHSDIDQRTCQCGDVDYARRQDPGRNFPMKKIIDAVRIPEDATQDVSTSLPKLYGKAPISDCPIF